MNATTPALKQYYGERAAEYERVYDKPERQSDLATIRTHLAACFHGRNVLDVACGTGYWTAVIAQVARSIIAVDVTPEVLDIAASKGLPTDRVRFAQADAYELAAVPGDFDAGLAAFWWSHVPRQSLDAFLRGFHNRLGSGTRVMIIDNRYVPGSNTPLSRTDANGDTFQRRSLDNGRDYEVLKNFPSRSELAERIAKANGGNVQVTELEHFWIATYDVQ